MPKPTPTYEEIAKAFPEKGLTKEQWETMPPLMRGIYEKALDDLLTIGNAAKGTPIPTRTKTPTNAAPTPASPAKTPTASPTPTPTGGFAYLMDPETQKVKRVPWAEVADWIEKGWVDVST